jgi:signal transduction histidine kinase
VQIIEELAPHLPKIRVDKKEMERVFLNLALNALAAMPQGGNLTISTRVITESVEIRVRDSGCGIPKKYQDRIFDPFFTIKEQGTGLGLSISHRIIEEHKGTMDVESKVGKGTTFTIRLPITR